MDRNLIRRRDELVERIRHELRALVHESGWTQRRVEEANGFTQGYLSQVLQGHIALTVRHLCGILLTIGMRPEELLARVQGRGATEELRERMDRYEALLERLGAEGLLGPEKSGDEGP